MLLKNFAKTAKGMKAKQHVAEDLENERAYVIVGVHMHPMVIPCKFYGGNMEGQKCRRHI